jgi:acid stress chaperone HdeB
MVLAVKTLAGIIAAIALAAAAPAQAQKLDLSTVTCRQFLQSKPETINLILMWVAGYYSDEDDPPILDFDKMRSDATKLGEYCAKNPDTGLVTAIEESIAEQ